MSRQPSDAKIRDGFPDRAYLVQLMKKYGSALFEPCPSSETLVGYTYAPDLLDETQRRSVERHLDICLDCQDKIRWLTEPSDPPSSFALPETVYVFQVQTPREIRIRDREATAYAAQSSGVPLPAVPYIFSEDGSFYAEIGQDLDDALFLHIDRLPAVFRWHALKVRAMTQDRGMVESPVRTVGSSRIELGRRADIVPEDIVRVELHFTHLRPQ
ncbi:MAG: hypothetical protein FJY97_08385 [candidate division Zixibacteria bacterium]|nr:hypothetical protein [candidate division Zixibacteria bacterium]